MTSAPEIPPEIPPEQGAVERRPADGGRRLLVGDIQGCRGELEALLEAARFDPARDRLLPVGDLVGRGPEPLATLKLLVALGAEPVLGNHDLHLLAAAAGRRRPKPADRLDEVLESPEREPLLAWLRRQPFCRAEPDLLIVHAALHPGWADPARELAGLDPLGGDGRIAFATRVRWCDPQGNPPPPELLTDPAADPGPPYAPWYRFFDPARHGGRRAVFGHWSVRGLVDEPQALGLDTGCVWGRTLTGWLPEEGRFVQVPARAAHARPGSGG